MDEGKQANYRPFQVASARAAYLMENERDKAIWNADLHWASQNAHMEVIDEFTGEITEAKVESMDLMDELYRVSASSILCGLEDEQPVGKVKLGGGRHVAYISDTLFDDDLNA